MNPIDALKELVEAIDAKWEGETERKRSNAISPRMEDALANARKVLLDHSMRISNGSAVARSSTSERFTPHEALPRDLE
jgi:hypothetical protein